IFGHLFDHLVGPFMSGLLPIQAANVARTLAYISAVSVPRVHWLGRVCVFRVGGRGEVAARPSERTGGSVLRGARPGFTSGGAKASASTALPYDCACAVGRPAPRRDRGRQSLVGGAAWRVPRKRRRQGQRWRPRRIWRWCHRVSLQTSAALATRTLPPPATKKAPTEVNQITHERHCLVKVV